MPRGGAWPGAMQNSPLDEPQTATTVWTRYRRILKGWAVVALIVIVAVLGWSWAQHGNESIHYYIAMALGLGFTVMLGGALMGLAFVSSGSGHDEAVRDWEESE